MVNKKNDRIGITKINKKGELIKCIDYIDYGHIKVQFQDEYRAIVETSWKYFDTGYVTNPCTKNDSRIGQTFITKEGYVSKCISYTDANNITVEIQDGYKTCISTSWRSFKKGNVKNPYHNSVYGVGIIGEKYETSTKNKHKKEYDCWRNMIGRCYDKKTKEKNPTYKDVTCCEEWLLYENFYEWLHGQENFDKWLNGRYWNLDKDILIKGNKIYSPNTCCLVPHNINMLFVKKDADRGNLPIGVHYDNKRNVYIAQCNHSNLKYLGQYNKPEEAFFAYKKHKEQLIKMIAQEEYDKCNITKKCYDALLNYKIEITD